MDTANTDGWSCDAAVIAVVAHVVALFTLWASESFSTDCARRGIVQSQVCVPGAERAPPETGSADDVTRATADRPISLAVALCRGLR